MKKNYFILKLILLFAPFGAMAQVVNGNFENVKPNFLPSNWGMNFIQEISIDPQTGETFSDQIQYTWCFPSMVYASTESKDGQYAMEVSNAYNWTTGKLIPGSASIFNDPEQDSPGWNPGVPVNPGTSILLLGFDYKFLPVGNDIAEATLTIFDAEGNELGSAALDITGMHSVYEYVYTPVSITHPGTPALMYINFNMAKSGSTPTFGTRLIVDNVRVNFSSLITAENQAKTAKVWPTITDNQIHVIPSGFSDAVSYKIINSEGRIVKQLTVNQSSEEVYSINVSDLSSGIYFLNLEDETNNTTKKFIRK